MTLLARKMHPVGPPPVTPQAWRAGEVHMKFSQTMALAAVATTCLWSCGTPQLAPETSCSLVCEYGFVRGTNGETFCQCRKPDGCDKPGTVWRSNPTTGACEEFSSECYAPEDWSSCEVGCWYEGSAYPIGAEIAAIDGCNTCWCRAEGLECSDQICPCHTLDADACEDGPLCRAVWETDCSSCMWQAPCCGLEFLGCLTQDQDCSGAWLDTNSLVDTCHGSDDAILPRGCCGPDARCRASGGRWDPEVCGGYLCGEAPPSCGARSGGCDCGPDSYYVQGVGCELWDGC
ncbi:MAG: hypothetical protein A2289_04570 [Deltaproteobacteria bacterium RIFOXYA12_FULL_58_15]|nr:MAG: hypothetical protein A2289_04570 [Deltaproteobacteria bacterium RIFOXYA12_FULL_58_15]